MEEKRMGQMSAYIEAYCQHLLSVARVLITCLRIFLCMYLLKSHNFRRAILHISQLRKLRHRKITGQ